MRYLVILTLIFSFTLVSCGDDEKKETCKLDTDCKDSKLCDTSVSECKLFECEEVKNCYEFDKWSEDKDLLECNNKLCVEIATCTKIEDCKTNQVCLFKETQNNYFCEDACLETSNCKDGETCENLENTELKACFAPLFINGQVTNNDDSTPIKDAFVTVFKTDDTFISDTITTDELGNYSIYVPVIRNVKGEVLAIERDIFYKLRVSALNFQNYPSFIRVSIPFKFDEINKDEDKNLIYNTPLSNIVLFPLNIDNLKMISGKLSEELPGVLVVAEHKLDSSLSSFTYTDVKGSFNIVNLSPGEYRVVAYKQGYNFSVENITVSELNTENLLLNKLDTQLGSISGSISIVNGGDSKVTSVVVVPESTFNDIWRKGEFTPGLRAPDSGINPNIDGDYKIENIPVGNYVVLAAFENDLLVQDPDTSISGTQIVHFSIPEGNNYDLTIDSFKITEAIKILTPGKTEIEEIDALTEFKWVDDSSEDGYDVELFDSFGNKIFEKSVKKSVVKLAYNGEALKQGYYYQWKVSSFKEKDGKKTYISKSEDLRGIFKIKIQ